MTSSSLSINRKRFLANSLKSYWWLMLINAILYFMVGPMLLIMRFDERHVSQYDGERWQEILHEWFYMDGFYGIYLLTVVLAIVMGLVMFNFLHHKRQVNFYHALPISRKEHFIMRLGIGAVLVFVPLVVMLLLMIVIDVGYGAALGYVVMASIRHLGRLILFFLLCYGLTILAGQLTGNVLTHIFMTLLLHFGLLLLYGCLLLLGGTFFATFYISNQMEHLLECLSPVGYLVSVLESVGSYSELAPYWHMSLSGVVGVMAVALIAIGLAFVLYLHRPSEASGQPIIYKGVQQPLKWVILFLTATVGATAFLEISGKKFMVFGCILFIVLTQMVVEVVFHKDFKAIGKHWQGMLGFMVLYLALIGSLYYDVWGYDAYVPEPSDVQVVQISFSNLAEGYPSYRFEDSPALRQPEQIANVVALLEKVTDEEAYAKNWALHSDQDLVAHEFSTDIFVKYTMHNGKTISRNYNQTPVALYEAEFAKLYNSQEFKQAFNLQMLEQGSLSYVSVDAIDSEFLAYTDDKQYRRFSEDVEQRDVYGSQIKEALYKDLQNRSYDSLKRGALYVVNLQLSSEQADYRYHDMDFAIYAEDVNTLAVIDKLQADNRMTALTAEKKAEMIERVDIYRLSDDEAEDVRDLRYRSDLGYIDELGTKLGEMTDIQAIMALLPDVVTSSQLSRSSAFVQVDYHYIAVATMKGAPVDAADDDEKMDNRIVMYYLLDHLPE